MTLGVIGCGNMGRALIQGVVKSRRMSPRRLIGWDPDQARLRAIVRSNGIVRASSNLDLTRRAKAVLLAVKPQQMDQVLREIRPGAKRGKLVISIAAGVPIRRIQRALGPGARVIRVMPNTPALVGQGMAGISAGRGVTRADLRFARRIFEAAGQAIEIPEAWMDAVTALSGSGPAYFFFLMEAMIEAGVKLGLSRQAAQRLVKATAAGAAALALAGPQPPRKLRRQVTSKGGTTEAAFRVFKKRGLAAILRAGIFAACRRARQLSRGR
ncbi:MAG: pyrroline-5-carboxylate reductase [Candidatus Omnitrophica bacterium]|nr:pyrroline-5-carboxylate reductase [Candidatus Omnitrophota bacterium]